MIQCCVVPGRLGAWDWGVGTTGQHLWGLTNGVPLRSKKGSPRIFDCVWPMNAARHFLGAQERRSLAFPLTLTTELELI